VRRLGVDVDPSTWAPVPALVRETHHADPAVAAEGELRSELVTVVATDRIGDTLLLVGFLAGADHDGTIRARLDGATSPVRRGLPRRRGAGAGHEPGPPPRRHRPW
jgi:hypothetical protein